MKLIDFDGIFNNKMAKMIEKHAAEHTESEWEDLIADLYKKFGDTPLKELGTTPRAYFGAMSESALVETLKEYLLQDISVPDFLCEALEGARLYRAAIETSLRNGRTTRAIRDQSSEHESESRRALCGNAERGRVRRARERQPCGYA